MKNLNSISGRRVGKSPLSLAALIALQVNPKGMSRLIQLSEGKNPVDRVIHLMAEVGDKDAPRTWETLTRVGKYHHGQYGDFEITLNHLNEMVKNFKDGVYGQKIFIDVQHKDDDGAAAEIIDVRVSGKRLMVHLEWTEEGRKQVKEKGRRYLSIEYHENYQSNEYDDLTGQRPIYGAVLTGGGLVLKPHVKGMKAIDPHALAEAQGDECHHVVLHPTLAKKLHEEQIMKQRQKLLESLRARKLSEAQINAIMADYDSKMKGKEDNVQLAEALTSGIENALTQLGEVGKDQPISLSVNVSTKGVDDDAMGEAVAKALQEANTQKTAQAQQDAKKLGELQTKYKDVINGSKSLGESEKAALIKQGNDLVAINLTEDQVVNMAGVQLSQAEEMIAARKLGEMGFAGQGSAGAVMVNTNAVQLGERIHGMTTAALKNSNAFAQGSIKLTEFDKLKPFTKQVLGAYDSANHQRLLAEEKQLSDGTLNDTSLPASIQRQVITEVVDDHKILELVQTVVDATGSTTANYPYEERDKGPLANFGIVPEGAGIPNSGVTLKTGVAYLVARKIAMKLSKELIHFSAGGQINWDAWGRTIAANTTLMREELARWVSFEIQRVSDSQNAQAVAGENIAARLDGSNSIIKLANFPLVPEFQRKDIQGNNVGTLENAIVVDLNGTIATPYPVGAKTVPAGMYYIVNSYNLGLIQLVNESAVPQTPTETTATVSYSHATNVEKFDTDLPADTKKGEHYKALVSLIGKVKARMYQDVGVEPDFGLCAATLHADITDADNFTAQGAQAGTNTTGAGDLEKIKDMGMYRTNTGSVLGEERLQLGVRGTTTWVVNKPFAMEGNLIDCVDSDGQPTGQKMAYGVEFSGLDTPVPNRDRYKAIIAYSAAERAAL